VEVLDGNTVIQREQIAQPYLVVMTVAEGSWKVRVLEELPNNQFLEYRRTIKAIGSPTRNICPIGPVQNAAIVMGRVGR